MVNMIAPLVLLVAALVGLNAYDDKIPYYDFDRMEEDKFSWIKELLLDGQKSAGLPVDDDLEIEYIASEGHPGNDILVPGINRTMGTWVDTYIIFSRKPNTGEECVAVLENVSAVPGSFSDRYLDQENRTLLAEPSCHLPAAT